MWDATTKNDPPKISPVFVAPDVYPSGVTCQLMVIPNAPEFRTAIYFMLNLLSKERNWQPSENVDAETIAEAMTTMLSAFVTSNVLGAIVPFYASDLPAHTLLCDGSTYARSDYPALWEVIPVSGKTATTFNVPDLRDMFIKGESVGEPTGTTGGEKDHILTLAEMPSHTHTSPPHTHGYNMLTPIGIDLEGIGLPDPTAVSNTPFPQITAPSSVIIDSAGGGQQHNNEPQYYTLKYAIFCG